jgi:hypothetical protein
LLSHKRDREARTGSAAVQRRTRCKRRHSEAGRRRGPRGARTAHADDEATAHDAGGRLERSGAHSAKRASFGDSSQPAARACDAAARLRAPRALVR